MAARGGGSFRARSASAWDMGTEVSGAGGASMKKGQTPQGRKPGSWRGGGLTGGLAGCAALGTSCWGPSPQLARPGAPPPAPPPPSRNGVDSGAQPFTSYSAPPPPLPVHPPSGSFLGAGARP